MEIFSTGTAHEPDYLFRLRHSSEELILENDASKRRLLFPPFPWPPLLAKQLFIGTRAAYRVTLNILESARVRPSHRERLKKHNESLFVFLETSSSQLSVLCPCTTIKRTHKSPPPLPLPPAAPSQTQRPPLCRRVDDQSSTTPQPAHQPPLSALADCQALQVSFR